MAQSLAAIPYIPAPVLSLDFIPWLGQYLPPFEIFGPIVVIGVVVGMRLCLRFARAKDLDLLAAKDLMFWSLIFGFLISHWVSVIYYYPTEVARKPWILLNITAGLSSVGGFLGAVIGSIWFLRRYAQPILVYADMSVFGMLTGFTFGRFACAWVHDHPGRIVDASHWLAVGPWQCLCDKTLRTAVNCCPGEAIYRFDLGLIEFGLLIPLIIYVYFIYDWKRAAHGRLCGLVCLIYGAIRWGLDFFREDKSSAGVQLPDPRYLGLTVAQYLVLAMVAVGVWLLWLRKPKSSDDAYPRESARSKNN